MSAFDEFPSDDVLIARGKCATISGQKRDHLRLLRDDCETLGDCARNILNGAQNAPKTEPDVGLRFAQANMAIAEERLRAAKIRLAALAELEPQLEKLKSLAWGKTKPEEQ